MRMSQLTLYSKTYTYRSFIRRLQEKLTDEQKAEHLDDSGKLIKSLEGNIVSHIVHLNQIKSEENAIEDIRQSGHKELSVDIVHEICTKRITNVELKKICIRYGVDVQGQLSNEDIRRKLMRALESGDDTVDLSSEMNKLFPSFNHTNGGFIFGHCEHGIVYYTKFLTRGEGSRDILDAVLSFRNQPKYVIYDDAGRLAEHAWKRLGPERCSTLIGLERGRVLEATQANVEMARECLRDRRQFLIPECPEGRMLLLCDRFHQFNSKSEFAVLRFSDFKKYRNKMFFY